MKKVILNIFVLIIIAIIIVVGYNYSTRKVNHIEEDGFLTFGNIVKVDDGGEAFDISATYEYKIAGKIYSRKVEISSRDKSNHFSQCVWSPNKCAVGFAWVLYSNREPSESLINLDHIYLASDTSKVIKPKNFEGFY